MKNMTFIKKPLPQNPDIWVSIPNYKEPILPVNHGGFGWYGLQAYDWNGDKLMCHECGMFFDSLGQHISIHELSAKEYRNKFCLQSGTKLLSNKYKQRLSNIRIKLMENPEYLKSIKKSLQKAQKSKHYGNVYGSGKKKLQYMNMTDSCPSQLIRRVQELAKENNGDISRDTDGSLSQLLIDRFGSFNKAKQLAGLAIKEPDKAIEKHFILEDMISFFRKYKRWPTKNDYENKKMLYSYTPIGRLGHIVKLRQEAMQLKDEQDKRPQERDIAQIANNIEMEYAGRARV